MTFGEVAGGVITLTTLAVGIPVIATLGNGPTFFVAHRLSPSAVAATVIVILVLPVAVALAPVAASWVTRVSGLRQATSAVIIGALLAVLMAQYVPASTSVVVSVSIAFGAIGGLIYIRSRGVRRAGRELSFGMIVVPAWFFLMSPAASFFSSTTAEAEFVTSVRNPIPITILVLDEMHTAALLDGSGEVDDVRFPNFGDFAADSIWFPNALANVPATSRAIPTILTGNVVSPGLAKPPTAEAYPSNLLNALSASYDVAGVEVITSFCAERVCNSKTESIQQGYIEDVRLIFKHATFPPGWRHTLPELSGKWAGFGDVPEGNTSEPEYLESSQSLALDDLLASIGGRPEAQLNFIHILEPHVPYDRLADGRQYELSQLFPPGIVDESGWTGEDILIEVAYHRYLHQVGYADQILGAVLDAHRQAGIYDDALILVTADHGVSFVRGDRGRRSAQETGNVREIHNVPFFIKLPKASTYHAPGSVRDDLISHVDIIPTLAHIGGWTVPWPVSGTPLFPLTDDARSVEIDAGVTESRKFLLDSTPIPGFDRLTWQVERFGERTSLREMTRIDGVHGELIGKNLNSLTVVRDRNRHTGSLDAGPIGLWALPVSQDVFLPARVKGRIDLSQDESDVTLALALNGILQSVTETSTWLGTRGYFESLLPPSAFLPRPNALEVFIVESNGAPGTRLIPVDIGSMSDVRIQSNQIAGATAESVTIDGEFWNLGESYGHVDSVQIDGQIVRINGWSASPHGLNPADEILLFAGDQALVTSTRFVARSDVSEHVQDLGGRPCESCAYGWIISASLEQMNEALEDVRVIALFSDSEAGEVNAYSPEAQLSLQQIIGGSIDIRVERKLSPDGTTRDVVSFEGELYEIASPLGNVDVIDVHDQTIYASGWFAGRRTFERPTAVFVVRGDTRLPGRARFFERVDVQQYLAKLDDRACWQCSHGWSLRAVDASVGDQFEPLKIVALFADGTAAMVAIQE